MAQFSQELPLLFFTKECLKEYLEDFNFTHGELCLILPTEIQVLTPITKLFERSVPRKRVEFDSKNPFKTIVPLSVECFKSTLSKTLGLGIIAGSVLGEFFN